MYRFSRSIYRDLAPYVIADPPGCKHVPLRVDRNGHLGANGNGGGSPSRNLNIAGNGAVNRNGHANGGASNGTQAANNARPSGNGAGNRQRLLDACEATMRRLATDRRYFAHPARSLFGEVRMYFPIHEQDRAFAVIERNLKLAIEHLERLPEDGLGLGGQPSECRAHTRRGTPCQRQPLPGRDYCPSHKHLEESLEPADEFELLDEQSSGPQGPVGAAA